MLDIRKVNIIKIFQLGPRLVAIVEVELEDGVKGLTCFYESTGHNSGTAKAWLPISGIVGPEALVDKTKMSDGWLIKSFIWATKGNLPSIRWNDLSASDHKNLDKRLTFENPPCDIHKLARMIEVNYQASNFAMPRVLVAKNPTDPEAIRVINSLLRFELKKIYLGE